MKQLFTQYKLPLLYASALVVLLLLLQVLQYRLLLIDHAFETYMVVIALLFTALGGWLAVKLMQPKTLVVERVVETPVIPQPDPAQVDARRQELGLSTRELEVLQLMARGMSNQEIADALFLSVPTVKTHSARLFEKLDVRRRTQAVERGRQLHLIG